MNNTYTHTRSQQRIHMLPMLWRQEADAATDTQSHVCFGSPVMVSETTTPYNHVCFVHLCSDDRDRRRRHVQARLCIWAAAVVTV